MQQLSLFLSAVLLLICLPDTESRNLTLPDTKCGGKEKASALLDIAKDFINTAKDLYPTCIDDDTNCGRKEKSFAFLEVAKTLISDVEKSYPTCNDSFECPEEHEKPMDCTEVLKSGQNKSGVYTIWPRSRISFKKPLTVYCDMDTDGGGWTVIQRRGNFSNPPEDFYRDWQSYKEGFGNITQEFWLGNDNIYAISNQAHNTILFALENVQYAQYQTFWIEDELSNYTLHIKDHSGNLVDEMSSLDTMKFSTKDRDNDEYFRSCAEAKKGAWWYKTCGTVNLNGIYNPVKQNGDYETGITWRTYNKTFSTVEIKLRPL